MNSDEQIDEALRALAGRLRDEVSRAVGAVGDGLRGVVAAERAAGGTHAAQAGDAVVERLAAGIRTLDAAPSLGAVLQALVDAASMEAAHAAVYLVRNGQVQPWAPAGKALAARGTGATEPAAAEVALLTAAIGTGGLALAPVGEAAAPAVLDESPQGPQAGRMACPLLVDSQVVGVLYADGLSSGPAALEVLARHAARCLESLTAGALARGPARAGAAPPAAAGVPDASNGEDAGLAQAAAHRYARLLVSEIKLYSAAEVEAGRRERDLAARLGVQIARARVSYEERIPSGARGVPDYFDEELVRTLADGDRTLLGAGMQT